MKTNRAKLFGIIALIAIIGVTFAACNKGGLASSSRGPSNTESDFEAKPIDGGKSVEITKYIGDKWEVGIPSKIRNLPVTNIGNEAFREKNLIKITIPNSVTTIGQSAFRNNQLTSVTIPNSVTTIGNYAFANNPLTSVTISNSVTTIGQSAFYRHQLTSVTIPNSVTTIGDYAFGEYGTLNEGGAYEFKLFSVTIGTNVDVSKDAFRQYYNNEYSYSSNGFKESYDSNGKVAGTYVIGVENNAIIWTKQ